RAEHGAARDRLGDPGARRGRRQRRLRPRLDVGRDADPAARGRPRRGAPQPDRRARAAGARVTMATPVALVTGASRGIGKRLAVDLAQAGWDVVGAARSSRDTPSKLPGTGDDTAAAIERAARPAMPVSL